MTIRNPNQTEDQLAVHEEMFRTLLRTPHRKGDETLAIHTAQFERDPNFYGKMAIWAVMEGNCAIRDVNEIFTALMLASPYQQHREAGYVMLQTLPPHEVGRVVRYFTGYDEIVCHHSYQPPMPTNGQHGLTYERAKYPKSAGEKAGQEIPRQVIPLGARSKLRRLLIKKRLISPQTKEIWKDTWLVHHRGLGKRMIRGMLKHAIRSYLRVRENNRSWMEGALLRNRDTFKSFYLRTHTAPQVQWVNDFLFRNITEEGTRLHDLKRLAAEKDPTKQAEIIIEAKLPYPSVVSVLTNITPSVIVALISSMSDQELQASLKSLKARGAYDNAETKALINDRLDKIKVAKKGKTDAMKGAIAASVEGLDAETKQKLNEITDSQLKHYGEITDPIALLVDKSGSMNVAMELAKDLGSAIAQACKAGNDPLFYLFDRMPIPIEWTPADGDPTKRSSWVKKLEMFQAQGGTLPNNVVRAMIVRKQKVRRLMLVTDEEENAPIGAFAQELKNYEREFGIMPSVAIARVGRACDWMERSLKQLGIPVDVYDCRHIDKVSVPNLIEFFTRPGMLELVLEILALPLPTRAEWDEANLKPIAEKAA